MVFSNKWLLSLINFFLNAIWYLNMVIIAIALCTLTVVYVKNDHTDITATVKYRSPETTFVKALTSEVSAIVVQPESAKLRVHMKITAGIIISSYMLLAIYEVLALLIIYNLRKVFASVIKHQPFEYQNIRRLKMAALGIILFMPLNLLIDLLNYWVLAEQVPRFHDQFKISDTGNLMLVVLGLAVYVLADVFHYGFELKKENEEFV